uniref:Immunoglobulin V-set domain-containing protein n=1 Tax=Oreochromis aureus TaxID=47969 RepID=A0A668VPJ8_OREAU
MTPVSIIFLNLREFPVKALCGQTKAKMRRLQNLLFTFCSNVKEVESYAGYSSINCPYESQYQNSLKYICRGNQPSTCLQEAIITSDNRESGRFRLNDVKMSRIFTVTISSLTQSDSGYYLCDMVMSQNRFTLRDDIYSNSFSVMITKLEEADAGTYWCGSDSQWRVGNYTKIQLSVGEMNTFK